MADREKVIRGLAICSTPICRTDCPYDNGKVSGCIVTLMKDALELLKGQEARVMTKDEANGAEVTWLEVRGNEPYATLYANTFKPESYGKYYRCWNYKPTDEQRKAVKWDD